MPRVVTVLLAGAVGLLACATGGTRAAGTPTLVPLSALVNVQAIGATDGALPVYVATSSGLYRSASSNFAWWTRQNAMTTINLISPNPRHPNSVIFAAYGAGLYHSSDGGKTSTSVPIVCLPAYLTRSTMQPTLLYATWGIGAGCGLNNQQVGVVERSTDDGMHWSTVYTITWDEHCPGLLGTVAIDPTDPNHALAGVYCGPPSVYQTRDGGQSWSVLSYTPDEMQFPGALAFNPLRPAEVWLPYITHTGGNSLQHSTNGGRTWHPVTAGLPKQPYVLQVTPDPLTGRAYLSVRRYSYSGHAYAVLYAQDDGDHFARVAPDVSIGLPASLEDSGQWLYAYQGTTITRNGYLIAAVNASDDAIHLFARKLSAAGTWTVSSEFTSIMALRAVHLLGAPLSPTTTCLGQPCQYFAKGALAAGPSGSYSYVALLPRLIGAQVRLPVGASISSLTYRDLFSLHNQRTPLPAGLRHGTLAVHGGTFIPYSPTLSPASGYVVPASFWRYLTDRRQAPDGWQRDFGLPLTPAVPATVSKGKLGTRHILVQAFQKAILTYDPHNPAPFRVERANVGADYAAAFPAAVR